VVRISTISIETGHLFDTYKLKPVLSKLGLSRLLKTQEMTSFVAGLRSKSFRILHTITENPEVLIFHCHDPKNARRNCCWKYDTFETWSNYKSGYMAMFNRMNREIDSVLDTVDRNRLLPNMRMMQNKVVKSRKRKPENAWKNMLISETKFSLKILCYASTYFIKIHWMLQYNIIKMIFHSKIHHVTFLEVVFTLGFKFIC